MPRRPFVVTLVCWMLIIYYLVSFLVVLVMTSDPDKFIQAHHGLLNLSTAMLRYRVSMMFLVPMTNLALAIMMLKGHNWSRYTYLVFNSFVYFLSLLLQGHRWQTVLFIFLFGISLLILFSERSKQFFINTSTITSENEFD